MCYESSKDKELLTISMMNESSRSCADSLGSTASGTIMDQVAEGLSGTSKREVVRHTRSPTCNATRTASTPADTSSLSDVEQLTAAAASEPTQSPIMRLFSEG